MFPCHNLGMFVNTTNDVRVGDRVSVKVLTNTMGVAHGSRVHGKVTSRGQLAYVVTTEINGHKRELFIAGNQAEYLTRYSNRWAVVDVNRLARRNEVL
jgi:hypothetical protein